MKLLFIRHGDPDYVHDSLTEKGFREANALAAYMQGRHIDSIYCSPYGRAKATAKPSLEVLHQTMEVREFLHEFDAPVEDPVTGEKSIPWDYFPAEWTRDSRNLDIDSWWESDLYQGQQVEKGYHWVCSNLDELLAQHGYVRKDRYYLAERPNHDTIALFCHFGVTCVMLSHLLNISPIVLLHAAFIAPTSITVLETEERENGIAQFRLRSLGATPHLMLAGEPTSASGFFREVYTDPADRRDIFPEHWG